MQHFWTISVHDIVIRTYLWLDSIFSFLIRFHFCFCFRFSLCQLWFDQSRTKILYLRFKCSTRSFNQSNRIQFFACTIIHIRPNHRHSLVHSLSPVLVLHSAYAAAWPFEFTHFVSFFHFISSTWNNHAALYCLRQIHFWAVFKVVEINHSTKFIRNHCRLSSSSVVVRSIVSLSRSIPFLLRNQSFQLGRINFVIYFHSIESPKRSLLRFSSAQRVSFAFPPKSGFFSKEPTCARQTFSISKWL